MTHTELALLDDVAAAQDGDQIAFGRLIGQTQNTVHSIAMAIVQDLDGSEDVAQQVYIAAWQGISDLKNNASFLPWLRQTTRNLANKYLRSNRSLRRVDSEQADAIITRLADPTSTVQSNLEREDQNVVVAQLIADLPAESREIVLLYYREQQSTAQVAALLGMSEANVRQKLSRTRKALRFDVLQKCGEVILYSAPPVSFGTTVLAALTAAPKAGASTLAVGSTAVSGAKALLPTSQAAFGLAFLGSALGIVAGVLGIKYQSRKERKALTDEDLRQAYDLHQRRLIWVTVGFGLAMPFVAPLTTGWVPVTMVVLVFLFVMMHATYHVRGIMVEQRRRAGTFDERAYRREQFWFGFAALVGCGGGLFGLLMALTMTGRLVF